MRNKNDVYIEKDKVNAPFLLSASFNNLVEFIGSYSQNGILYWQFSPKDKVLTLLDQFNTKKEPHIPARDLFSAIETFWKQVVKTRNEGMKYGERGQ
ncbi:hypothetical protein HY945_05400 [Candidatus Gottesmanbacteria bacterium]|nr:hypothetical protein [Candidatus Gottesmanbacteria bacterium]